MVRFLWRRAAREFGDHCGQPRESAGVRSFPCTMLIGPAGVPLRADSGFGSSRRFKPTNPNAIRSLGRGKGGVEFKSQAILLITKLLTANHSAPTGEHVKPRETQGHGGSKRERLGGKRPQAVIRSIRQGQGVGDSKMLRIEQKGCRAPQSVVTGLPSLLESKRITLRCGWFGLGEFNFGGGSVVQVGHGKPPKEPSASQEAD